MVMVLQRSAALWLAAALASPVPAQQPATPGADQSVFTRVGPTLRILVLEGEGSVNDVKSGFWVNPVIEVRDVNDRPVEGAEVLFQLPIVGPGGFLSGQQLSRTTKTNFQGQARLTGFRPNNEMGRFQIKVKATSGGQTAIASITQTNAAEARLPTFDEQQTNRGLRRWVILGLVGGAGAGVGLWLANRGGSSTVGPAGLSLVPGALSIGPPR